MQKKVSTNFRSIISLFISIGFLAVGYSFITTLTIVYLKKYNCSDFSIGLINSSFFLGSIVATIWSQKIISTTGHIRSFSTFATIMSISFLVLPFYVNEWLWGVSRFFTGFSYYGLLIIIESWLNEKTSNEKRGQMLAIYSIVYYVASSLGQLMINIEVHFKSMLFIMGTILVLCSIVFISLTRIKEPKLHPFEDGHNIPKVFSLAPLSIIGSLISGMLITAFFTMMPIYVLDTYGNSKQILSMFLTISIVGGLISQWPIGILSDKYGRRQLIAACSLVATLVSVLLVVYGENEIMLYVLGVFFAMSAFCIHPLSVSRANDMVDDRKVDIVEISRSLLFTYGIGSFLSPVLMGVALYFFDTRAIFAICAILSLFLLLYSLSKEKVNHEELSVFVNIPPLATQETSNIDPRQDHDWIEEKKNERE